MIDYLIARFNVRLPARQRGLTTTEYALAGALIVLVVVAAIRLIGTAASSSLRNVGTSLK
jgi:Flp pilus assembly pilin Flp